MNLCLILGCSQPTTCDETEFGCCPDGVSPAKGRKKEGCPPTHCEETLFGCCPDGIGIAEGNDNEGCEKLPIDCKDTELVVIIFLSNSLISKTVFTNLFKA